MCPWPTPRARSARCLPVAPIPLPSNRMRIPIGSPIFHCHRALSCSRQLHPHPRTRAAPHPRFSDCAGTLSPRAMTVFVHERRVATCHRFAFAPCAIALALVHSSAAMAAGDADLAEIREQISQLKESYEARIQALEQRLKSAESKSTTAAPAAEAAATPTASTRRPQRPRQVLRHSIRPSRRCCRACTPTCRRIRINTQSPGSRPAATSCRPSAASASRNPS